MTKVTETVLLLLMWPPSRSKDVFLNWNQSICLAGCHDEREISRKNSLQADENVDQRYGGEWKGFQRQNISPLFSSVNQSCGWYECDPILTLGHCGFPFRWQAWMVTTGSLVTQWWRCCVSTETASWLCWRHLCTTHCSTGGWWIVSINYPLKRQDWIQHSYCLPVGPPPAYAACTDLDDALPSSTTSHCWIALLFNRICKRTAMKMSTHLALMRCFSWFLSTANTKGNKRSRTGTDSYTAGHSVGEYHPQQRWESWS